MLRHFTIPFAATAALLFATTTMAWAGSGTSPGVLSGKAMLTDAQMDKVTAGDVRDAQKRQAKKNKVPFGQCKTGPGASQCH